tara:strand:+ start:20712 stop:23057 length:2346 start_codon:yes stop_codon:yes gene_type:complete
MKKSNILIDFKSKAKTLESLIPIIKDAYILPILRFTTLEYKKNTEQILKSIQKKFDSEIIIRSSASNEDNTFSSNAGGFKSILNVDIKSKSKINSSIVEVINSIGNSANLNDEVFIQPMLNNADISGVIFSSDIDTLSKYYIINYDQSGSTSSVTSGVSNNLKTLIHYKNHKIYSEGWIKSLINITIDLEEIFGNFNLDIEFGYKKGKLYIFQVRPIVKTGKIDLSHVNLDEVLRKLHKKINKLNSKHPNLIGKKTLFGVMPDWNPAEIIGLRPKRLALSLYKELITDETWAYQRNNYGYRNLRSHPLLVSFAGIPFIDVRVSFNSFIPKDLDDQIASKLVDLYLDRLKDNKHYHDKVEFEIIYSCFYFGIEKNLSKLDKEGFNTSEISSIKKSLLNITNKIINVKDGLYKQDLEKINILKLKYDKVLSSEIATIDMIYWLIKDARRYGTLPFAGIARAAFIAIQFLKSFVIEKIISEKDYDDFLNSLNTVSKQMSADLNILSKKNFLDKYGHLRPGTYDIMSLRYDEGFDVYFNDKEKREQSLNKTFKFSDNQKTKIKILINESGIETNVNELLIFIREAIEGREYSKFIFTKSLSKVLTLIQNFGTKLGISKEDMSYLNVETILNLYSTLDNRNVPDILNSDIELNKKFYEFTSAIKLPDLITDPDDIYSFYIGENEPNFITLKQVQSYIVKEEDIPLQNIEGKIICIKSADPGYDFLFSKNIGGLITCYGGANSHMAIRCAELGIPAVIGCGEALFNKYNNAYMVSIDSANKHLNIIK